MSRWLGGPFHQKNTCIHGKTCTTYHITDIWHTVHWTKLLASSNSLFRSSSYGISKKAGEELWSKEHTPNCPKHREPTDVHVAWEATCEGINRNLAMTCQDFGCALVNAHSMETAVWDLGENLIPKSKVYVEWPLLVVFVPVAPVGDAAWTLNQHGPTSPWNERQMQWTSMDPRACNQRTQHPNTMTQSRSQDASSFFLLASWQPENTVNIRAPFTGSTEAVMKSRFLLPMSRWLGVPFHQKNTCIHGKTCTDIWNTVHWTKPLASSNFLLRSSSYGIGQRKQERSYDPKNTHQIAQNIGSQRMYMWREKPRVKASTGNLAMTCQDFRCALVNAHRMETAVWDLGENLIPKSKVYVEWPLLVAFVPVAPVGDAAWTLNQHGPTSPWNERQMQWTSMDPRACNQRTQHPNTMTQSRSQDASSFFLLASWQPENTVNIRAPFTGSTEAVIKSRFLLPMSRWLGGSVSSEEHMYTWKQHVRHIKSLTFEIQYIGRNSSPAASSNFLFRSSSYGIGQRKQERSYDPKNAHQTAKNIRSQRMYMWREKPRVKASIGNLAMTCQDFRCALVNAHRMETAVWDLGENLIPKSKVYVEWPLLVVFVPVAPVGDAAWTLNQHGPTSPWKQSQMQWASMDPRACNQRTQHPNKMTRSRSQDASSFFLLASWQPENTVNLCERFTGSKEAVIKSRFLLPMSRWLGSSLSSEEHMYTWKIIPPVIYHSSVLIWWFEHLEKLRRVFWLFSVIAATHAPLSAGSSNK